MFGNKRRNARSGVAATETAVLLPFVVMIAFASIEFCNGLYLQESITLAAYEASAVLSEPQSRYETAESACAEILKSRRITEFAMKVSPDPSQDIESGELITVTVSAPMSAFSMGPSFFLQERSVMAEVTTVRMP